MGHMLHISLFLLHKMPVFFSSFETNHTCNLAPFELLKVKLTAVSFGSWKTDKEREGMGVGGESSFCPLHNKICHMNPFSVRFSNDLQQCLKGSEWFRIFYISISSDFQTNF